MSVKGESAEERTEDQTGVYMMAAVSENRVKRWYHQRGQRRAWNIQQDPNHGRRASPGGRSAVLNATDKKKKDEAGAEAVDLFVWSCCPPL